MFTRHSEIKPHGHFPRLLIAAVLLQWSLLVAAQSPDAAPAAAAELAAPAADAAAIAVDTIEPLSLLETASSPPTSHSSDIVLLLDNSGSMKVNDPKFLTSKAVTEFINQLEFGTRLGIVIFDQKVTLALPLSEVTEETRSQMRDSLKQINYRGLRTNSPDGLERAIYELKLHARADSERFIVFLTDGIVDTGDKAKDALGVDWMRKELAADAKDNGIRIFGIAFTDGADFKLIQSLAQQTDAEYYRAYSADEIAPVFGKIRAAIASAREAAAAAAIAAATPPEPEVIETPPAPPAPKPIIVTVPEQSVEPDQTTRMLLFGIAALVVILLVVVLLRRGGGDKTAKAAAIPEVKLLDNSMISGHREYILKTEITQIGRVKGKESPGVTYIVIDQKSISRHHAVIEYRNHAFWIMDQGSGNGTTLNGKTLTEERHLKHGDIIGFDTYEFTFMEPGLEQSDATVLQASPQAAAVPFDEDDTALLPGNAAADAQQANIVDEIEDMANWDFESADDREDETVPPEASTLAEETGADPAPAEKNESTHPAGKFDGVIEKTDVGFQPSQTMTPDEFDRLFSEIDKNKK